MQELWEDISEQEPLYKKLWSFGVRSLRSLECGLYKAAEILLGDHLYKKSDAVQWVSVEKSKKEGQNKESWKGWPNQTHTL